MEALSCSHEQDGRLLVLLLVPLFSSVLLTNVIPPMVRTQLSVSCEQRILIISGGGVRVAGVSPGLW